MATIRFKLSGGASTPPQPLKPGLSRLGRGDENEIKVEHSSVSWNHCRLELSADELVVRDCGSRNGTFLNEQRVTSGTVLREGQVLRVGDIELLVEQVPVKISVPDIHMEKRPESVKLGDGSESCTNHPSVRASWRCTNCKKPVCDTCVHDLHLKGRPSHKLCPLCSHHCEPILWDDGKGRKKSIWGAIKGVFSKSGKLE